MVEENATKENVTTHKLSDYEFKSWSYGLPVPEGWERCPGDKVDVVRRLKPISTVSEEKIEETTPETKTCCNNQSNKDAWKPWNKPCGGCC
jgi:hypothetical protein